jgi:hypothetical protein
MAKKAFKPIKTVAAGWTETGLPTPEQVEQTAQQISTAPPPKQEPDKREPRQKKTLKKIDPAKVPTAKGRPSKDRVKFTCMLNPGLRNQLNAVAIREARSISDIIELALVEYFELSRADLDKMKPRKK